MSGAAAHPTVHAAVLVADDQPHVVDALRLLLKPDGYDVDAASAPAHVLDALARRTYDVVVLDMNYARETTSGREGLDLIAAIRRHDALTPVVVMTGWSTVDLAVEAMQRGAVDFVQKPWDNERVRVILRTQTALGRASRHAATLEARRRADEELAMRVQRQLLPAPTMATPAICAAASCRPAGAVGGDFYDFIRIGGGCLGIALGDVAGKGVAAALLMANLQALLRSGAPAAATRVAELVAHINSQWHRSMATDQFATFFWGVFEDASRRFTYVNAGHNPPLLVRRGGCDWLTEGGPVIGPFEQPLYDEATRILEEGDTLILYTDGITEATSSTGEEFGEERLARCAAALQEHDCSALRDALLHEHAAFTAGVPQRDDMTLVVARVG